MRSRTLARVIVLMCYACSVAAAQPITVVATRAVAMGAAQAGATHALSVHAYVFSGTSWSADDVAATLPAAAELLRQCGVALNQVELTTIDTPLTFHYYETSVARSFARAYRIAVPALLFVEDTRNDPAFDAEAIGVSNSKRRPELANTIWITYGARDLPHAIAHELVHLLTDSGDHSNEPLNLMRDETSPDNSKLTPAQCERIRRRGVEGRLLTPLQ